MGLLRHLERRNTDRIVDGLRTIDPTLPVFAQTFPCSQEPGSTHEGLYIQLGDMFIGLFRCNMIWYYHDEIDPNPSAWRRASPDVFETVSSINNLIHARRMMKDR